MSETDRIAELEATIERLERELAHSRELRREVAATAKEQAKANRKLERQLADLRRRRSVRLVMVATAGLRPAIAAARGASDLPRRTARSIRHRIRQRLARGAARVSPEAETALVAAIRRDLPPALDHGPLVSIVILNRDGREHLERCLRALATTAYRDVEIVVVDNGSSDGSAEFAERFGMPFPLTVIRNDENRSFSDANDQGAAAADGELICFLNNDVDPITEHWLGYLVETMTTTDAAAVGARLIYPRNRGGMRAGKRFADLTLQHGGVAFDRADGIPMPRAVGAGDDPMSPAATIVEDRPALTAACLLVRRSAFEAIGGFDGRYDYGLEDVDLCLRLRDTGGRLVYDGRAALWHHESATRAADADRRRERVEHNREVFLDTWGPRLYREALVDAIGGGGRFSSTRFHVAIAITSLDQAAGFGDWYTGHELGAALEGLGWLVSYLERTADGWVDPDASVEAVIVLLDALDIRRLPRHVVTMAWVRSWPERWIGRPWFDEYDLVFASSQGIVDMVRAGSSKVATCLPIATNPDRFAAAAPDPTIACDVLFVGSYWGQHRAVIDALPVLADRGYQVHVHGRGWDQVPGFEAIDRGFLAYVDVPRAYASARIVVDDATVPVNASGSVNSRVFDALAAGAVVVTDGAIGVHALFDDDFPTWSDPGSLVRLVESILADPAAAAERAATYRKLVLDGHTYSLRAVAVRDALLGWADATRYGLRIGVPGWDVAERWGDYHFARALQRSLERAGHPTRLHLLADWAAPVAAREDVTVHLLGLKEAPTRGAQVNLLWQISHPDLAQPAVYDRYDHAFVASDPFAARMGALATVPVTALHQATDPERFRPDPTGLHHELLFVANSRFVRRRIVDDLAGTSHDLAIYGANWRPDLADPRFVKGEHIANADLAGYYSSADIVLNDHWDEMRAEGFISNRLYDALACGAFVISDHIDGIETEFDDAVATYQVRTELEAIVARYLGDPVERRRRGEVGRAAVLARHTFDARTDVIRATAGPLLATKRARPPAPGRTGTAAPSR